jgi:hypothetical protein
MPTTDNSMSTRTRFIKGRVLASFALSGPIKPQLDQSNETYEIIQQGEKPYVTQPPIGGTTVDTCVCTEEAVVCITPTISDVSVDYDGSFFVCTVTVTGSPMSVQWYYITGSGPSKFNNPFVDDPPDVSGSTTTQLTLDAGEYAGFTIVCSGADPCAEEGVPTPAISSNEVTLD